MTRYEGHIYEALASLLVNGDEPEQTRFDLTFEPAPPIASLAPHLRARIEAVRQESRAEIAALTTYWDATAKAQDAHLLYENTHAYLPASTTVAPSAMANAERKFEGAAEHARNLLPEARQAQLTLEMRLGQALAPELAEQCKHVHRAAYNRKRNRFETSEAFGQYLLGLVDRFPEPPEAIPQKISMHKAAPPMAQRTAEAQEKRLQELEDSFEKKYATKPKREKARAASMREIANDLWLDTISPRLKQPRNPQPMPHIESIIREMVGMPHQAKTTSPAAADDTWVDEISRDRVPNSIGTSIT